jgi:hypothetical protein
VGVKRRLAVGVLHGSGYHERVLTDSVHTWHVCLAQLPGREGLLLLRLEHHELAEQLCLTELFRAGLRHSPFCESLYNDCKNHRITL